MNKELILARLEFAELSALTATNQLREAYGLFLDDDGTLPKTIDRAIERSYSLHCEIVSLASSVRRLQ